VVRITSKSILYLQASQILNDLMDARGSYSNSITVAVLSTRVFSFKTPTVHTVLENIRKKVQ